MIDSNWSYIVRLTSGEVIQVNAEKVDVGPSGGLTFWCVHQDTDCLYITMILAPGTYERCSIMSQMSGLENGFEKLKPSPF
jgi:hypothetical protein